MTADGLRKTVEKASLASCDKEDLISAIEKISVEIEEIDSERKKIRESLEHVRFLSETVGPERQGEITNEYGTEHEIELRYDELDSLYREYEDYLDAFQQKLNDYRNFDKCRCFENIRFLLKEKSNVKIGQIEKEAGVSPGYMSRLEKKGNTSEPSTEFIVTAAKMLGISLDVLLLTDLTSMTPTEKYFVLFMQKLIQNTLEDKLEWHRDSADSLNYMEIDENGCIDHPLFDMRTYFEEGEDDYPDEINRVVFTSHTFDCHTYICGDCYRLNMKDSSTLYLMDICKTVHKVNDQNAYAKEIWIHIPYSAPQFLVSNRDISKLTELVEKLFDTVKNNQKHPKIKRDIRRILDAFIDDDDLGEDDLPDDLPFA